MSIGTRPPGFSQAGQGSKDFSYEELHVLVRNARVVGAGDMARVNVPCPRCGPLKPARTYQKKPVLAIFVDRMDDGFLRWHCPRCPSSGGVGSGNGNGGGGYHPAVTKADIAQQIAYDQWRTRRALAVWQAAGDLSQTLAHSYLASRSLIMPLGVSGRVLRFHPKCPWTDESGTVVSIPALVGLYRDIQTDAPKAIWRRPLTPAGRKAGAPKALGPVKGCAIKLSAQADVTNHLCVGEGVETVLAAMQLHPECSPAWALGCEGGMRTMPVLDGVSTLVLAIDNDPAGLRAAEECSVRWTLAGRTVLRALPNESGADMNDVLLASTTTIQGLAIRLPRPCRRCGETVAMIAGADLTCRCGARRGTVGARTAEFLVGVVRTFGRPDDPVII